MDHVEKLKDLIDTACAVMDWPSSEKLARYLVSHGVTVAPLAVEIGMPVYVIKAIEDNGSDCKYNSIVSSIHYLQHCICNNVKLYIVEKPATKSDSAKLGKLVFLTKEEAEAKLKEYRERIGGEK